jgi:prepilin-type N-terminal cleavage/methylation domain-containing protein
MKILKLTSKGFSALELLIVLLVIGILGGIGFYVRNAGTFTSISTKGWKTYTSIRTGATFEYPTDWPKGYSAKDDSLNINDPLKVLVLGWDSNATQVFGSITCSGNSNDSDSCSTWTVTNSTPLPFGHGLVVASGYVTVVNTKTFKPWIAIQQAKGQLTKNGTGLFDTSYVYNNQINDLSINGLGGNLDAPSFKSEGAVKSFLKSKNARIAKQVLLTLRYGSIGQQSATAAASPKKYSSKNTQASFTYPGSWFADSSDEETGLDMIVVRNSGKVEAQWISDGNYYPSSSCNDTKTNPCSTWKNITTTPIKGAPSLSVVAGYAYDPAQADVVYAPYVAVQSATSPLLASNHGNFNPVYSYNGTTSYFATTSSPDMPTFKSIDEVQTYLNKDPDVQSVKQILSSLTYK